MSTQYEEKVHNIRQNDQRHSLLPFLKVPQATILKPQMYMWGHSSDSHSFIQPHTFMSVASISVSTFEQFNWFCCLYSSYVFHLLNPTILLPPFSVQPCSVRNGFPLVVGTSSLTNRGYATCIVLCHHCLRMSCRQDRLNDKMFCVRLMP